MSEAKFEYLRISVTDRCNFRCIYCITHQDWKWLPHEEILRFEEIEKIVKTGIKFGLKRVRLTGGEPLLRKDIEVLIKKLCSIKELTDVSLTTNGYFLPELGEKLKKAGLKRINISLDTLSEEKFEKITGVKGFKKVLEGIDYALELGFSPVKINVVVIRGINDDEVLDIAKLSIDKPIEVRFIEFMPIGKGSFWKKDRVVSVEEIKKILGNFAPLENCKSVGGGPAEVFKWKDAKGKIGFISPITHSFCNKCNRMRITADGRLRPCLFSNFEINLKSVLRKGEGDLEQAFRKALEAKRYLKKEKSVEKLMVAIGG